MILYHHPKAESREFISWKQEQIIEKHFNGMQLNLKTFFFSVSLIKKK